MSEIYLPWVVLPMAVFAGFCFGNAFQCWLRDRRREAEDA